MPNQTEKRNRFKATVIAAAIALLPLASHAAGLGKITVLSALGQPLKAELEVTATRDEVQSMQARVAAAEAFRQAGIEYAPALATLRFSRDIKERDGHRYVEISTDRPLNEPFIDMLVELTWASGRLVREYTFLLDPPDLAARVAPVPVAPPVVGTAPAITKPVEKPEPMVAAETRPKADSSPAVSKRPADKPATKPVAKPPVRNSHEVVSGDTLSKIAAQTKPEGVSLDQMLVSLFRSNRDAFIGDNMNRLKAGKIISIPDAAAASAVPASEAREEIVAQAVDFNAYRKRLASIAKAAPAKERDVTQSVAGKIAPKVEDKAPQAKGKDKLEVSRTEAPKEGKTAPLQGRIAALEEDLVSRERAINEASSRVKDLERNLNDLKKLAEMKSQAGADLQKQAQAMKPDSVETKKPDLAPSAPVATVAEAPKPVEAPKPAEAVKPADAGVAAKPADGEKPVEAPKPPVPAKKAVIPPPPEPEPDFIEENAPLVFGGGAVVALLLGWLGLSAFRKKRVVATDAVAPMANADLSAHSVFSTTVAPPASDQEPSQFSSAGLGMVAHQETVDPIVEADTFLAFGRDAQAEEILLEALKTAPQRQAIHLKLLDIYAERKNVSQFESVARQLRGLTGGVGTDWEKAAAMGADLDPGNSLYGSKPSAGQAVASVAAVDMGATMIFQSVPEVEEPASKPAEPVPTVTSAAALDFDLGMDAAPADDTAGVSTPLAGSGGAGLDFDLDLGASEQSASNQAATPAEASSAVIPLDIDFDMPAPETSAPALDLPLGAAKSSDVEKTQVGAAQSGGIDFDFDLGTDSAASQPLPQVSPEVAAAAATPTPPMAPLNLGGISLELDTPAAGTSDAPGAATGTDAPDNPEVATKIELALAYEEMGDRDGARELLQEAVAEGSPAQQQAARAKLDSLG